MYVQELREQVMRYLLHAEEEELQACYDILQPVIHPKDDDPTAEQMEIVEQRRMAYMNGDVKLKTWDEVKTRILSRSSLSKDL